MGEPHVPNPVLLVTAAFSHYPEALDWARQLLEQAFGPVELTSATLDFDQTRYYERDMGAALKKRFFAFRELVAADSLAKIKRRTNDMESELARSGSYPVPRPLNLDPGFLSLGKFQLATTKDQSHRIYVGEGVYAEVTLRYQAGCFEPWPWTYADYRQPAVLDFLQEARDLYRRRMRDVLGGSH
jgi:hypothetical protein